jgi:periplasmic protein CpxP/Spy
MKTMHLILGMAALMTAASAHAQSKPTQDPAVQQQRLNERNAKLTQDLGLSAEQSASMKELDTRYNQALNDMRASTNDRAVIEEQNRKLREEYDAEVKKLLTPEQYTKLMESRNAARQDASQQRQQLQGVPAATE